MKACLHILIILILGLTHSVKAQNYLQIFDAESLEPLAYAHVKLTELNSNQSTKTISDDNGGINIPYDGETRIELSYIGYESFVKTIKPGRTGILYAFALETEVDEVVVTGSPKEISIKESMYDIDVIAKEELEQRAAVNLSDALMNQLNVQISRDGVLGSQINLQGLGGNNVKIMIDGVPVIGRLDGNLDLSQINMNNIERIEVVEGPLSAIYGSNAIAGVINLISKQSQKNEVEGFVNGYYESIGSYNVDALVGFKKNRHLLQLSGGRYFFDGWSPSSFDRDMEWNPKEQYFGGLNYVYRTKNDWFHKVKGNYFQDRILNRYDPAGSIPTAFDDWYSTQRIDGNYTIMGNINEKLSFNSVNSYNHYNRIKNRYQKDLTTLESTLIADTQSEDNQDTTQANQWMTRTYFSLDNPAKRISVQAGIDINIENGKGGRFQDEDGSSALIADLAGFVSTKIQINEKLSLQPALRYAYNTQFKVLPTPSLQFKYGINDKLTFRFNYGMGFRAPSLKELYLIFNDANHNIFGNQDLIPEQSQNVSSSLSFDANKKLHKYQLNTKLFYNYKYNAIALTPDDNNVFQYVNIAKFNTMGAQVDGKYSYKNFTANVGLSYTGLSNNSFTNQADEKAFFFYPQIQSNFSYFFRKANLSLSLYNKWNGSRKDFRLVGIENTPEQVVIDAYDIMDFTVQKGFWE
ncbi:MAG: outer membrane receptor for ferrienterochelin and colicins, partial [Flavobacteriaceae bacterium]